MSLATRIQEVRKSTKLNKVQFRRLAGVSHAAVGQWESGSTGALKFSILMRIEKETGYRASWIDTGKGEKFVDDVTNLQRARVTQKLAALSTEKKQQLNAMSPAEISERINNLSAEQRVAIQAMLDSWDSDPQAPN